MIIGEDVNNWNHYKVLVTVSVRKMRQPLWKLSASFYMIKCFLFS